MARNGRYSRIAAASLGTHYVIDSPAETMGEYIAVRAIRLPCALTRLEGAKKSNRERSIKQQLGFDLLWRQLHLLIGRLS